MSFHKFVMVAVMGAAFGATVAPVHGKAKAPKATDVEALTAEVARLRADLDAAVREIAALKAAAGGKVAPEEGPRYRGRSAKSWLEQLKDLEPKTRIDALEALGALAAKDKKLIPVLVDSAKNDTGLVPAAAVKALGEAGPEALSALIELVNDKQVRFEAINVIGRMGPTAKSAVPVLAKALEEESRAPTMRSPLYALRGIGPDAKEAIPALVKALGKCLEDIGKSDDYPNRFGVAESSLNVLIVDTLRVYPERRFCHKRV
jgi:outer membrane murein-binding lipoprotein Lpp